MRMEVKRNADGRWVWQIVARNGRVIGESKISYVRSASCERIARKIAGSGITTMSIEA